MNILIFATPHKKSVDQEDDAINNREGGFRETQIPGLAAAVLFE